MSQSSTRLSLFILRLLSVFIASQCFVLITDKNANESGESVLRFNDLAYVHHLHNPCVAGRQQDDRTALIDDDNAYADLADTTDENKIGFSLLRELVAKSTFLQGLTTNIIRLNLIEECSTLRLPYVANVLSVNELKSKAMIESLRLLYTSLTNQTAHVFFIWDEQQKFVTHNCTTHHSSQLRYVRVSSHQLSKEHAKLLALHYWTIAVNLRDMMCLTDQALSMFNIDLKTKEAADKVLLHSFKDTSLCSRKAVRDCQIMKTTIALLQYFTDYLRDQLLPISSTSGN